MLTQRGRLYPDQPPKINAIKVRRTIFRFYKKR